MVKFLILNFKICVLNFHLKNIMQGQGDLKKNPAGLEQ